MRHLADIIDTGSDDLAEYYPRKSNAAQTYFDYNGCYPNDYDKADNAYLFIPVTTL